MLRSIHLPPSAYTNLYKLQVKHTARTITSLPESTQYATYIYLPYNIYMNLYKVEKRSIRHTSTSRTTITSIFTNIFTILYNWAYNSAGSIRYQRYVCLTWKERKKTKLLGNLFVISCLVNEDSDILHSRY